MEDQERQFFTQLLIEVRDGQKTVEQGIEAIDAMHAEAVKFLEQED